MLNQDPLLTVSKPPRPKLPGRSKPLFLLLFVLAAGTLLFLILQPPTPPAVQLLPTGIVPYKTPLLYRYVPMSWGWFWRSKEWIFGRSRAIHLNTAVYQGFELTNLSPASLVKREPQFRDAGGLQIWILEDSELEELRPRLKASFGPEPNFSPRVITADKVQARLSASSTILVAGKPREIGFSADFLPRIRRDTTDLSLMIVQTSAVTNQTTAAIAIRTNLSTAARIQIPHGSGVFLLNAAPAMPEQSRAAIVISTELPSTQKR